MTKTAMLATAVLALPLPASIEQTTEGGKPPARLVDSDKIMSRVVYRRIGNRESIVAVHSVDTAAEGGGVRWYELVVDQARRLSLAQQGTYAPGGLFRWMPSPAIDRFGNIGIG